MPYKPTGRPRGRPRKNPDASPTVERDGVYTVELAPAGTDYIERRARVLGVTPAEVIRVALREYARRCPLSP